MALIDKASLLMVPSTYEAGKLYNVLPSGNRAPDSTDQNSGYDQTRADFDFDRGSNAAATRVNASGLIEKYRENLLVQSNQFDTTWSTANGASVTSGQSGYDGSSDAWTLETQSGQTSRIIQNTTGLGSVNSLSVYAKANTLDWIRLQISTATGNYVADFDLTNGVSGFTFGSPLPSIQSIGSGWYRVTISGFAPPTQVRIYAASGNNNLVGAGTILIQSAQLESGLVASSYLDSGATTAKAGVLVDLPRINYDANGQNGSLLLEPSRANIIESSEYLGHSTWINTNLNITHNQTISPEGVQNAGKIVVSSSGARLENNMSITGGTDFTISAFVKKTGSGTDFDFIRLQSYKVNDGFRCWFNITNGTKGTEAVFGNGNIVDSSIEDYGDGWYRISVTGNIPSSFPIFWIVPSTADNVNSVPVNSEYYMWGAQAESGSYVSSYIPTMGTSETRAADECSVTGVSDVIGQTEGTMFLEFNSGALDGEIQGFSVNDGSSQNRIVIFKNQNDRVQLQVRLGGVVQASIESSDLTANTNYKAALAYANNDVVLYLNGTQVGTDTSATIPTCSDVCFDSDSNGGSPLFKETKQALLFKTRLTNAELAALTL